jgi:hypothetical protein
MITTNFLIFIILNKVTIHKYIFIHSKVFAGVYQRELKILDFRLKRFVLENKHLKNIAFKFQVLFSIILITETSTHIENLNDNIILVGTNS